MIFRVLTSILLCSWTLLPTAVKADAASHVVISEIQTGTAASAGQEFVELYNPTAISVDLSNWALEYKSAGSIDTAANWKKYAALVGTVKPYGFYLISQSTYLPAADANLSSSGLASTGGNIRIKEPGGNVIDKVGYGVTANSAETAPAPAPGVGQSLERLPGRLIELGGNGQDTDDNFQDFIVRPVSQPQNTLAEIELPDSNDASQDDMTSDINTSKTYQPIQITELFIDPQSPLSDSEDEYIELHNPNLSAADLTGYTIKSGTNFHDYYNLPATTLEPGAYLALYASQTHLSLVNSGGAAQLLDPNGQLVDQTPEYEGGHTGEAWAKFDTGWSWTIQITPAAPNILIMPLVATTGSTAKLAAKSSKLKTASKSSKTTGSKSTKKSKAKSVKAKIASAFETKPKDFQLTSWLIIGLAALTIGYAIYEFRYDLQNIYRRARGNR